MSSFRKEQKNSLKNEKKKLIQELNTYDAILTQDKTIKTIVRGREVNLIPENQRIMIRSMRDIRNKLIQQLPKETDKESIKTMNIPERIKYLDEQVIPTIKNRIEENDNSIESLNSTIGNMIRATRKKGGRKSLKKKKNGIKSLKKRRKTKKRRSVKNILSLSLDK